jgi:hypothetical protein
VSAAAEIERPQTIEAAVTRLPLVIDNKLVDDSDQVVDQIVRDFAA